MWLSDPSLLLPSLPEPNREGCSRGRSCDRAHVIPYRPTAQIIGPHSRAFRAGWVNGRQSVVSGNVEKDGHQNRADEIEQTASEKIRRSRSLPSEESTDCQHEAGRRSSEKCREEYWIDHDNVDRLHRGDSVRRRLLSECLHYDDREGQEKSGHQSRAQRGNKCQDEVDFVHHPDAARDAW